MGLDWIPGSRPKPGLEAEFDRLWPQVSIQFPEEPYGERFAQISLTAWDLLASQRIGWDKDATDWALELLYPEQGADQTGAQFVEKLDGRRVGEVKYPGKAPGDFSDDFKLGYFGFRGGRLKHCGVVISEELIRSAWEPKRTPEALVYGQELAAAARSLAKQEGINLRDPEGSETALPVERALRTVEAAARWCRFWASLGHWLEVSY